MTKLDKYFDRLMNEYYSVLINAWSDSVKESARFAIKELANLPKNKRADEQFLSSLEYVIRQQLGDEFAYSLDQKVKIFCERSYMLASLEPQFINIKIGFNATDMKSIEMAKKQQVFWLKNHYDSNVSQRLQEILSNTMQNQWTNGQLAENLQTHFSDILKGGKSYFQGLAEHTGLRVREFGRVNSYKKTGAKYYQIVAVIDDRTSDICRALDGKIYPVEPAVECMNAMFEVSDNYDFDEAKERLKRIAPFVTEDQIIYTNGMPSGVSGEHVPFPPFHWRCRTRTVKYG